MKILSFRVKEIVDYTPEQTLSSLTMTTEESVTERIRISDLTITPINDRSQLLIQWDLFPL
jgi:hypothetical protein